MFRSLAEDCVTALSTFHGLASSRDLFNMAASCLLGVSMLQPFVAPEVFLPSMRVHHPVSILFHHVLAAGSSWSTEACFWGVGAQGSRHCEGSRAQAGHFSRF
jgi:hypothetical protein